MRVELPELKPGERFVKAPEFYGRLGVSKSKFYRSVREGTLPAPIKISVRNSVWSSEVVDQVMREIKAGELKF